MTQAGGSDIDSLAEDIASPAARTCDKISDTTTRKTHCVIATEKCELSIEACHRETAKLSSSSVSDHLVCENQTEASTNRRATLTLENSYGKAETPLASFQYDAPRWPSPTICYPLLPTGEVCCVLLAFG